MRTTNTTSIDINGVTLADLASLLESLKKMGVSPTARAFVTHAERDRGGATEYKMSFTWTVPVSPPAEW